MCGPNIGCDAQALTNHAHPAVPFQPVTMVRNSPSIFFVARVGKQVQKNSSCPPTSASSSGRAPSWRGVRKRYWAPVIEEVANPVLHPERDNRADRPRIDCRPA
jgi:hypothetical protein